MRQCYRAVAGAQRVGAGTAYIHPEHKIWDCLFRLGKAAGPFWREQRGSKGRSKGVTAGGEYQGERST